MFFECVVVVLSVVSGCYSPRLWFSSFSFALFSHVVLKLRIMWSQGQKVGAWTAPRMSISNRIFLTSEQAHGRLSKWSADGAVCKISPCRQWGGVDGKSTNFLHFELQSSCWRGRPVNVCFWNWGGSSGSDSSASILLECKYILLQLAIGYDWRMVDEFLYIFYSSEVEFHRFQEMLKTRWVCAKLQNMMPVRCDEWKAMPDFIAVDLWESTLAIFVNERRIRSSTERSAYCRLGRTIFDSCVLLVAMDKPLGPIQVTQIDSKIFRERLSSGWCNLKWWNCIDMRGKSIELMKLFILCRYTCTRQHSRWRCEAFAMYSAHNAVLIYKL